MREDGDMAVEAISIDAVSPSLDSTDFYWVGAEIRESFRYKETEGGTLFHF